MADDTDTPARRTVLKSIGGVSAASTAVATGAFSRPASASTAVPADDHPDFAAPEYEVRRDDRLMEKYGAQRTVESLLEETARPLLEALAERGHIRDATASSLGLDELVADGDADLTAGYEPRIVETDGVARERIATDLEGDNGRIPIDIEPGRNTAYAVVPGPDEYTVLEQTAEGELSVNSSTPECTSERCDNSCNCVGLPYLSTCTGTVEYMVHYGNGVKRCGDVVSEIACSQPCEGCCSGDCGPYSC
jgi:hypothetical protein